MVGCFAWIYAADTNVYVQKEEALLSKRFLIQMSAICRDWRQMHYLLLKKYNIDLVAWMWSNDGKARSAIDGCVSAWWHVLPAWKHEWLANRFTVSAYACIVHEFLIVKLQLEDAISCITQTVLIQIVRIERFWKTLKDLFQNYSGF